MRCFFQGALLFCFRATIPNNIYEAKIIQSSSGWIETSKLCKENCIMPVLEKLGLARAIQQNLSLKKKRTEETEEKEKKVVAKLFDSNSFILVQVCIPFCQHHLLNMISTCMVFFPVSKMKLENICRLALGASILPHYPTCCGY